MLRYFKTEPNRIRPEDMMIGHTGYLIFAVKTLPLPEIKAEAEDSPASPDAEAGKERSEPSPRETQNGDAAADASAAAGEPGTR